MQKSAEKYIRKAQIYNEVLRERAALALLLSIVVVIGVFWCLKLTGIAMAGDANCGIVEHVHRDDCTVKTFTCTLPENAYHAHADECYSVSYTCGINEHIHTASCYSNTKADLETPSDWEATINEVNKKLDLSEDLVAVARTQIGYSESKINYQADDNGTKHGYTRYGEWYGSPYGEWQAMFVSFCLNYSGLPEGSLKFYSGIETMRADWSAQGIYKPISEHTPVLGDIIFLDTDGNEKADHVGIVSSEAGDSYKLIIGDYFDKVSEIEIKKDNSTVMGASVEKQLVRSVASEDYILRADDLTNDIESLPTYDALLGIISVFEMNGDEEGYYGYMSQLAKESELTYWYWSDLGIYNVLVEGEYKFNYLSALWTDALATESLSMKVTTINKKPTSTSEILLIYGDGTKDVRTIISDGSTKTWDFKDWYLYRVKIDPTNKQYFYVDGINENLSETKYDRKPNSGGFLIYVHSSNAKWGVENGDKLDLNFKFKGTDAGYKESGYGTVSHKDISSSLHLIETADTYDFIDINLWNYGNNINDKWNNDKSMPGFQQGGGTTSLSSINSWSMNFGDNITADLKAGAKAVTVQNGTGNINGTEDYPDGEGNFADVPISEAMHYTLLNGYPALANGTSLDYLFSSSTYAKKVNTDNINGLFKYDETTGNYRFNCRENHAQFDAKTNTFKVYQEIITPNHMMYPFGNFMPLNDITSQATQVYSINKKYYGTIADQAGFKTDNGLIGEYATLETVLDKFSSLMGTSFTGKDTINKYFSFRTDKINTPSFSDAYLKNLYNIDFDEPKEFFFGMDIHMRFTQPKDGMTGPNSDQPMVFDFTGDDDVWVYIDGKLFLDLSGIHRHVSGRIDFVNGVVHYYMFNPKTGVAGEENGPANPNENLIQTVTFAQLLGDKAAELLNENGTFKDYSTHTLDFFYMERGAGSGVCEMNFNLPVLKKNSISVTKELDQKSDDLLGNPDFIFQVMKTDDTPLIGENVSYDVIDVATGKVVATGKKTGVNGLFAIKAGQKAEFKDAVLENSGEYYVRELLIPSVYEQYGTITVDGKSQTIDPNSHIQIEEDNFVGVRSETKNISDGSTAFFFHNHLNLTKVGAFSITKQFNEYHEDGSAPKNVTFFLKLDGVDIPVGTKYTLHRADGTVEYLQLTTAGQVTFTSGDKVTFGNILAGSMLYIKEDGSSSGGYTVVYNVEDRFRFDEKNNILIVPSEEAKIDVVNDKIGTKEVISLDKTLLYPDGAKYTFDFALRQIQGLADMTPVPGGTYQTLSLPMSIGSAEFEFTLNYTSSDIGTYYYLIQELGAQEGNGKDLRRYIVEITTEMNAENTAVNVISKKYYLYNETENSASLLDDQQKLHFENRIVRNLTLEKVVNGIQPDSRKFTFTIDASIDGYPITGTYAVTGVEGVESITFSSNGKASLYLAHGEKATICGLPYGTVYSITESGYEGFYVRYRIDSGEFMIGDSTADTTLREDMQVQFLNTGGSELPTTGGRGQTVFILVGAVLMLSSTVILYILKRRSERRLKK